MTEPEKFNEPQKHELHISFEPAPPKPKKVHRARDVCWLILASGLIGTVFHSSAVFGIVAGLSIVLYIATEKTRTGP